MSGGLFIRPVDPREGNEWERVGIVTAMEGACHSLDALGRPICGQMLVGNRPPHPIGECAAEGHGRCSACDDLMDIDGDDPDLMEAA